MNRVAIAYLTKDRPELTAQSLVPLVQQDKFDLYWVDGSTTSAGERYFDNFFCGNSIGYPGVHGGAGAAIVFALSRMLSVTPNAYDYVGLVEQDVLLDSDWYYDTIELFDKGRADGLTVGAVSARSYADRYLIAKDPSYAIFHNLGAGMVIFTREAARLVLDHFRTAWTSDNRRLFAQLAGFDIGATWAFQGGEHWLTADWHWDCVLARHGLASLALTPNKCQMIGQSMTMEQQGLQYVTNDIALVQSPAAFELYRANLNRIRSGELSLQLFNTPLAHDVNGGAWTIFPHQLGMVGGSCDGAWALQECRGFGTFAYRAADSLADGVHPAATLSAPLCGPAEVFMTGGEHGGRVRITDTESGFEVEPDIPYDPNGTLLSISIPGGITRRTILVEALDPGILFHGFRTREPQVLDGGWHFNHSDLPPVDEPAAAQPPKDNDQL